MIIFNEKVSPVNTTSGINILKVQDFSEIFFGVYEIEINKNKYPVEKISEHNGDPVVSIPVEMGGKIANYPFVLTKGKFEVVFNEHSDYVDIFESKIQDSSEEEPDVIEEKAEIFIPEVGDDRKNDILLQIQEAKKNALIAAKKELEIRKSQQIKQIREESNQKKQALDSYLESARENLVDEFTIISQRIKKEVFDNNNEKYLEIRETIDNKIEEIRDSLGESLKKDFSKSSQLIDKSIKQLVKELWENNINPKVDKELHDIAVEIHEKVSEIDNNLNSKLKEKADLSLLEGVDKELSAIRDANIELNNSLNKGVQKALSRVGNVDKKVIQISEEFERKLDEKEQEVVSYFDEKLELVKEETLDITDEARKYFQNLIQESRNNLLTEIRKIKAEKPIEYVLETKKSGKVVKDWDSIEKEWNTKIHDKIENVKTDLRKYVSVYASGGGTNATQYQDGGTMNGSLNVTGAYLSAGINLLDIFSGGGGGGSDVSDLSANWQNTYTTVQANSATWVTPALNYLPLSGGSLTGSLSASLGTALLPSYTFTGDPNIGMWSPTADTLAWSVGGVEAMRITSGGNVGIGTTSPSAKLHTISTTEQLRVGYDASNYMSATVNSSGLVTLDAVGSSAGFTFGNTTRPTSSGTGTPAANSLITFADALTQLDSVIGWNLIPFNGSTQNTINVGGSNSLSLGAVNIQLTAGATAVAASAGYTFGSANGQGIFTYKGNESTMSWSKRLKVRLGISMSVFDGDAVGWFWVGCDATSPPSGNAPPVTLRGYGLRFDQSAGIVRITPVTHDGTNYIYGTPVDHVQTIYTLDMYLGTLNVYNANDTLVATVSGGRSVDSTTNRLVQLHCQTTLNNGVGNNYFRLRVNQMQYKFLES
jgi:hypothetical protein